MRHISSNVEFIGKLDVTGHFAAHQPVIIKSLEMHS